MDLDYLSQCAQEGEIMATSRPTSTPLSNRTKSAPSKVCIEWEIALTSLPLHHVHNYVTIMNQ